MINLSMVARVFCVGVAASTAGAAVRSYEGFDYTAGQGLHAKAGGTGWSIPWQAAAANSTVAGPGLTHPGATPVVGNTVALTTGTALRYFVQDIDPSSTEFWCSVLMRRSDQNSGGSFRFVGPTGTETTYGLIVSFTGVNAPVFVAQVTGGNASPVASGRTLAPGVTDLYVMHVVPLGANYRVDLLVNPTLQSQGVAASLTIPATTVFRGVALGGQSNSTAFSYDEVRVGDVLADVTNIPAPGLIGVLGAAAVLGARRRRS